MSDNFKKPHFDSYFSMLEYGIIAVFYISLIIMTVYVFNNTNFTDASHIIRFISVIGIVLYILKKTIDKLRNQNNFLLNDNQSDILLPGYTL